MTDKTPLGKLIENLNADIAEGGGSKDFLFGLRLAVIKAKQLLCEEKQAILEAYNEGYRDAEGDAAGMIPGTKDIS